MLRNIARRWGFEKTTSGLAVLLLLRSVARTDACAMDPPSSQFLLVHPSNLHSFQLTVTLRACSVVYMSLVVNLIGQQSRDVIGRLPVSRDVIGCEDCKRVIGTFLFVFC